LIMSNQSAELCLGGLEQRVADVPDDLSAL
jgi:hypothetical protein